jgi:hypothetical protein
MAKKDKDEKNLAPVDPEVGASTTAGKGEKVRILVDKDMTDGGIRVNGKLYVGYVNVSEEQAKDLLRIQEEYFETKKKLLDRTVHVRMKNDFQKEMLFLADPKENEGKRGWTRDYGLLGQIEWSYCSEPFKEHLLTMRKQLFGY